MAQIKIGAATETEMKEKKARVEDALHATKAAVEEGIVPGGGVALLRAQEEVEKLLKEHKGDVRTGIQIVVRAPARTLHGGSAATADLAALACVLGARTVPPYCPVRLRSSPLRAPTMAATSAVSRRSPTNRPGPEPTRQIIHNAGLDEAAVIVRDIRKKGGTMGYNAQTMVMEDLVVAGVIDPAKVTKNALLNAASIAGLMLTTEALVSEIPEEKPAAPAMPGGGGMGDMY